MKGKRRSRPFKASAALKAYWASSRLKAVGRAGLEIARAMPRCGAKAKSTGKPCQQPALENGRCRLHGGLTPKGAGWHKIRMPAKGEQRGLEKFEAKLAAREKRKEQRRRRVAAMSSEQRERYERWHASRRPGPPSERARRRQQLATRELIDGLLAKGEAREVAGKPEEPDVFA